METAHLNRPQSEPRPTIPARSSLAEAKHWLVVESRMGVGERAQNIREALEKGRPTSADALTWLREVTGSETMKASWAKLILKELAA